MVLQTSCSRKIARSKLSSLLTFICDRENNRLLLFALLRLIDEQKSKQGKPKNYHRKGTFISGKGNILIRYDLQWYEYFLLEKVRN